MAVLWLLLTGIPMEESNQLKAELTPLKFEMGHLKSTLDAKIISHKEYVQNMVQKLEKMQADIEELKVNLIEKETELLGI